MERLKDWLPKLSKPIRIGEHDQTAFSFGLIWDWAAAAHDQFMTDMLRERIGVRLPVHLAVEFVVPTKFHGGQRGIWRRAWEISAGMPV